MSVSSSGIWCVRLTAAVGYVTVTSPTVAVIPAVATSLSFPPTPALKIDSISGPFNARL
jgi:hypothetical protein